MTRIKAPGNAYRIGETFRIRNEVVYENEEGLLPSQRLIGHPEAAAPRAPMGVRANW